MDAAGLLAELAAQGALVRSTAEQLSLDSAVPSCPGWTAADVLGHLSKVHARADWLVQGGQPELFNFHRPSLGELLSSYQEGLDQLLRTLGKAPASLVTWTSVPAESARLFWIRRMAHETAVHRIDLQLSAGFGVAEVGADFAADGIDELLVSLCGQAELRPGPDPMRTVVLTPVDVNASWTVDFRAGSVCGRTGSTDDADLNVFAMAADLYRWVWNRTGDDEVSLRGDVTMADRWRRDLAIGSRRA
jgi:uncharacterized protein (TIGR03083 family)